MFMFEPAKTLVPRNSVRSGLRDVPAAATRPTDAMSFTAEYRSTYVSMQRLEGVLLTARSEITRNDEITHLSSVTQ